VLSGRGIDREENERERDGDSLYTMNIMCCDLHPGELFIAHSTLKVVVMPGNPETLPSVIIQKKKMQNTERRTATSKCRVGIGIKLAPHLNSLGTWKFRSF
jgi:hypothetical protein